MLPDLNFMHSWYSRECLLLEQIARVTSGGYNFWLTTFTKLWWFDRCWIFKAEVVRTTHNHTQQKQLPFLEQVPLRRPLSLCCWLMCSLTSLSHAHMLLVGATAKQPPSQTISCGVIFRRSVFLTFCRHTQVLWGMKNSYHKKTAVFGINQYFTQP